ncbi:hypothetical protein GYMLUDRAFT_253209 [Collybiopsis luxurians FD-317 M1]|uniref:Uncharacterized protein n=1 Tax=Collybiopsis luxurians FD-317 M1 TaxID=944289 RepID=A0A0D0C625_9AGAR|nr:hypothetical protein GYMLUDRAFT_253209 [Collybiopsis luxurians FD-317 M1]
MDVVAELGTSRGQKRGCDHSDRSPSPSPGPPNKVVVRIPTDHPELQQLEAELNEWQSKDDTSLKVLLKNKKDIEALSRENQDLRDEKDMLQEAMLGSKIQIEALIRTNQSLTQSYSKLLEKGSSSPGSSTLLQTNDAVPESTLEVHS